MCVAFGDAQVSQNFAQKRFALRSVIAKVIFPNLGGWEKSFHFSVQNIPNGQLAMFLVARRVGLPADEVGQTREASFNEVQSENNKLYLKLSEAKRA
jgi:hypothetical protein